MKTPGMAQGLWKGTCSIISLILRRTRVRLVSLLFMVSGLLGCGQNDYDLVSDIDLINKLDSNLPP